MAGYAHQNHTRHIQRVTIDVPPPTHLAHALPLDIGPLALNLIKDNYGAKKTVTRVGRGIGSGRGRKSGRGMKGTRARAGNHGLLKNEGDQTPGWRKVPKRGFWRPRRHFKELSLHRLQDLVRSGRLPVPKDRPLTVKDLFEARVLTLRQKHAGVCLLGRGADDFDTPLHIEVQRASKMAIEAIERAGGKIATVYYSRLTLRGLLKPHKILKKGQMPPRPALPPPVIMRHYTNPEKRGYLSDLEVGDVVRPHEQPAHVRIHMRNFPDDIDRGSKPVVRIGKRLVYPEDIDPATGKPSGPVAPSKVSDTSK